MNFDDIMNGGLTPQSKNVGNNLTDIFGVDTGFAMKATRDLINLTQGEDSTDADIIQSALAMCDSKEELAVIMHLHTKAIVGKFMDEFEEATSLLEDTHSVMQTMSEDVLQEFAEKMMKKLTERLGNEFDTDEE